MVLGGPTRSKWKKEVWTRGVNEDERTLIHPGRFGRQTVDQEVEAFRTATSSNFSLAVGITLCGWVR